MWLGRGTSTRALSSIAQLLFFTATAMLAQRPRPAFTGTPNDGSRTITVLDVPTPEKGADGDDDQTFASNPRPVLKLRGGPRSKQRVAWKEEVIDNENCGRKKSKSTLRPHRWASTLR